MREVGSPVLAVPLLWSSLPALLWPQLKTDPLLMKGILNMSEQQQILFSASDNVKVMFINKSHMYAQDIQLNTSKRSYFFFKHVQKS